MSRITRTITAALAALALVAPPATAMPIRDAATSPTSPDITRAYDGRDLRTIDAREAGATATVPHGMPTWPVDPEPVGSAPASAATADDGGGTSPLDYVLPGLALSLVLAPGLAYAVRASKRAPRRVGA